jgi:hypothetical protein
VWLILILYLIDNLSLMMKNPSNNKIKKINNNNRTKRKNPLVKTIATSLYMSSKALATRDW